MCQFFGAAKSNHLIETDPTENIKKPKGHKESYRSITDEERECILSVAKTHRGGTWVLTMLYCGLRPHETSLIKGKHVKDESLHIPGTKSENADRIVPIPSVLNLPKVGDDEYFFTDFYGNKLSDSSRTRLWNSFKRQMNIEMGSEVYRNQLIPENLKEVKKGAKPIYKVADDLVPYCLRHTYCTDLQTAGVPINVAKELMGHSDISLTANIYTDFSKKSFDSARDAIEKYHKTPTPTPTSERTFMHLNTPKRRKLKEFK